MFWGGSTTRSQTFRVPELYTWCVSDRSDVYNSVVLVLAHFYRKVAFTSIIITVISVISVIRISLPREHCESLGNVPVAHLAV